MSDRFLNRLARFPKTTLGIFNINSLKSCFYPQRKKAARKFANPRLLMISFTTFRHWKDTMEYHRTKDILYVKKILGHKRIDNTLKYIDLEAMILKPANDHFTVRVASTVQEACELIESGFEYETEIIMMAEKSFVRGSETMEKTSPYKRENGVSKSLFTSTSFNSYVKEAHKREN